MAQRSTPVKASALRLLVVSPSTTGPTSVSTPSPLRGLLEAITGSKPADELTSFAGYTSHPPLKVRTKYYARDVGIWCDEIPPPKSAASLPAARAKGTGEGAGNIYDDHEPLDRESKRTESVEAVAPSRSIAATGHEDGENNGGKLPSEDHSDQNPPATLEDWKAQILASDSEAAEVRSVIGGILLLLPVSASPSSLSHSIISASSSNPSSEKLPAHFPAFLETAHALREAIEDESPGRDIASLVVLQSSPASSGGARVRGNDAVEAFEDFALGEGWFGWDFVAWDGQMPAVASDTGNRHLARGAEDISEETDERSDGAENDDDDEEERNEFNEKIGLARVLEVLEAVDWSASPGYGELGDDDANDFDFDELEGEADEEWSSLTSTSRGLLTREMDDRLGLGTGGLDFELQREMMELKMSMLGTESDDNDEADENDDLGPRDLESEEQGDTPQKDRTAEKNKEHDPDSQIAQFPALIERVVAIREAGAEMSQVERERFARREVARIMKEMG